MSEEIILDTIGPRDYHNIGVNLDVGGHSKMVMDMKRAEWLDILSGEDFSTVTVDGLVHKGQGKGRIAVAHVRNIEIQVSNDHSWTTGGATVGGTHIGATVRHREIAYTMKFDISLRQIVLGGGTQLSGLAQQTADQVPLDTQW